jgi:hypothetical protein
MYVQALIDELAASGDADFIGTPVLGAAIAAAAASGPTADPAADSGAESDDTDLTADVAANLAPVSTQPNALNYADWIRRIANGSADDMWAALRAVSDRLLI